MKSASLTSERSLWKKGCLLVAGTDEVGCGSWAGAVFAAAVILSPTTPPPRAQDSKRLSPLARIRLAEEIKKRSMSWAIGTASVQEIDKLNIRAAAFLAMRRALEQLTPRAETVLCDGFYLPGITTPCIRLIGGDHKSRSIAAASIIAKVARDAQMESLEQEYPGYGFARHKGYGTQEHADALKKYGICELHRRSFAPVQRILRTGN